MTAPAVSPITKVYAIQHCQIAPVLTDAAGSAMTYGTWIDVPGIKSLEIGGDMDSKELRGDNRLLDKQSLITGITASFEHAKLSLDVLAIMLGGDVENDTDEATWSLLKTAAPLDFGLSAVSAAGDAPGSVVRFVLSKCALSGFPDIGLAEEDYRVVSAELDVKPPTGTNEWVDVKILADYTPPAPWTPETP